MDQYYFDSGYVDASYFVYIGVAEATPASTSTMTVTAGVIKEAAVVLTSEFTQSAAISHIEGADLFAMSNAELAAEVSRIRDYNIEVTSAFTQVCAGAKIRFVGSDQFIDSTLVASNVRVRFNEAAIDAAFSLDAAGTIIAGGIVREAAAALTSEFTIDAKITRKQNLIDCDVTVTTEQTAVARRLAGLESIFDVVAFVSTAGPTRIRNVNISITPRFSTYSQNVAGTDDATGFFFRPDMESYRQIQPGWSVVGNPTWIVIAVDHTVDYGQSSVITITGGQFVSGATYSFTIDDSAKTSLTVLANEIVQLAANLTATAEITATISHIEGADLQAFNTASLSVTAVVTREFSSTLDSTTSQTTTALRIQSSTADLASTSTVSAAGNRIRFGVAAFTSTASLSVSLIKFAPNYSWNLVNLTGSASAQFNATGRRQPTTSGASYDIQAFNGTSFNFNLVAQDSDSRTLLDIGTKNATIEFWYSRTINTNSEQLVFTSGGISLYYTQLPQAYRLVVTNGSSTYQASYTGGGLSIDTQRHLAVVRNGTAVNLYIAGTSRIAVTIPSNYVISPSADLTAVSFTDNIGNSVGSSLVKLDEFRFSIGSARYTSTYTPPTTAFAKDGFTRALSNFDNTLYVVPSAVQATGAFNSFAQITANANKFGTVQGAADLSSLASLSSQAGRIQQAAATLQVQAFTVTVNGRIVPEQASLESAFFLSVELSKIKNAQASLSVASTVDATGDRIRFGTAALASAFVSTSNVNRIRSSASALTSAFSQSTVATEIRNPLGNDNWYKGLSTVNNSVEQLGAVYLDPYAFEFSRVVRGPDDSTVNAYILAKRHISTGNVVWQKWYTGAYDTAPETIQTYNGYIYAVFYQTFVKIDPEDGSIVSSWGIGLDIINDFVFDSDYIYFSGLQGTGNAAIAKYSLTGIKQWSKLLAGTTRYYMNGSTVRVVGSSVYWLYWRADTQTATDSVRLAKLSTSDGSITWSKSTGFIDSTTRMTVSLNGTVYITGRTDINDTGVFIAINSSGTLTGTPKHYSGLGTAPVGWLATGFLEYDSINDIIYYKSEAQDEDTFLKLQPNGTVTWARTITSPGFFDFNQPVITDLTILLPGRYIDGSAGGTALFNVPFDGGQTFTNQKLPAPFTGNWSWTQPTITTTDATYTSLSDLTISLSDDTNTNSASSITVTPTTYTAITYLYNVICNGAFTSTTSLSGTIKKTTGLILTNLAVNSAITINATKAVLINSTMTVTTTATITAIKKSVAQSTQQATATLVANNVRTRRVASALTSTSTLTANAIKTARAISTQQATATLTALPYDFTQATAALTSQLTLTATALRIQKSAVELLAFNTQVTAAAKIGVGLLAMDSNFTQTTIAEKTVNPILALAAISTVNALAQKIRNAQANLPSQSTLTVLADKIRPVGAELTVTATTTAVAIKTARILLALETAVTATAEVKRTRATPAVLEATASLTAEGKRNRLASATMTAQATVIASSRNILRAQANLTAFNTVLAIGSRIRFDPYYMLMIQPETRTVDIHAETRALIVTSETRVNTIKGQE